MSLNPSPEVTFLALREGLPCASDISCLEAVLPGFTATR